MLLNYVGKLNIGLPKIALHLSKERHAFGSEINGHLEIKGGLIKNNLKRYEIDLVEVDSRNEKEALLNNCSVYCKKECIPKQKEMVPFIINIPENVQKADIHNYFLIVRVVLENSYTIILKKPIMIQ